MLLERTGLFPDPAIFQPTDSLSARLYKVSFPVLEGERTRVEDTRYAMPASTYPDRVTLRRPSQVALRLNAGDVVIWRGDLSYLRSPGGGGVFKILVYV